MAKNDTIVFAVKGYDYLRDSICRAVGYKAGNLVEERWSNGEVSRELAVPDRELARGKNVILIGSTDDSHFLATLDFGGEIARVAKSLTFLVPFYRYSTMERREKNKPGRVVIPKNRAEQLSRVRSARELNRVVLCDLHTSHIEHYFDPLRVEVMTIDCEDLIVEAVLSVIGDDVIIGATDGGRPDWILGTAQRLGVGYALLNKKRLSGTETMVLGSVNGDVAGKKVVMRDDMIRSGGTAMEAAKKYLEAGATEVWIAATHPDFAPGAVEKLQASGVIRGLIVSDTYPAVHQIDRKHIDSKFVHIEPFGPFIAAALRSAKR